MLPADGCRYGVFDAIVPRGGSAGGMRDLLVLVVWCAAGAVVRDKMLYASSVAGLSRELDGVQLTMQACDPTAVTWEALLRRAAPNATG